MSESADDIIFQLLGQERALPGFTAVQVLQEGTRALAAELLPILSGRDVAFRVRRALQDRRPLSLIRLGDGEALCLAQGLVLSPEEVRTRGAFLERQAVTIPDFTLRRRLLEAVPAADLVGIPLSRSPNYQPLVATVFAAVGLRLDHAGVTHSLVNYELWKHGLLEPLLTDRRILLVGGPAVDFAEVLAGHGVPIAGVITPVRGPTDIDQVVDRCRDFDFDLALVSAGVSACVICPAISQHLGRVALDFGSCADEITRGEPWREAEEASGPLPPEDLRRVFTAAHGGYPAHTAWHHEVLRQSVSGTVTLSTARWDDDGEFGTWSFIAKCRVDPRETSWESTVLRWVGSLNAFRVPDVVAADRRWLGLSAFARSDLGFAPRNWWRRTVRALGAFHARSRRLLRRLPKERLLHGRVLDERAARWVESAGLVAGRLPDERRPLLTELHRVWRHHVEVVRRTWCATTLTHGDLHPCRVLLPDALDGDLAVVGWEQAAEHLPAIDLVALLTPLSASDRSLLLDEYSDARTHAGWPCPRTAMAAGYATMARLRLIEDLARVLAYEGEHQSRPPGAPTAESLASALRGLAP